MNVAEKQEILTRVLSGRLYVNIGDCRYVIKQPSLSILYEAHRIYTQTHYKYSFDNDWLTEDDVKGMLIHLKFISLDYDKNLKELTKRQEDLKLDMYNAFLNKETLDKNRQMLKLVKDKINEMLANRHMLDYLTCAGYAAMVRNQFIMAHSVYLNGKKVWKDAELADYTILNILMEKVNNAYISTAMIRELSRTDPWRSFWNASSANVFGKPVIKWTEEQKALVYFSKMYDNVFKNQDCPCDEIIEDDDLLDGWMIKIRREKEAERQQNEVIQILGDKHKNDTEIFLPARTKEEAQRIDAYNSPEALRIKKQREHLIRERGEMAEENLPDVQVDRLNKNKT